MFSPIWASTNVYTAQANQSNSSIQSWIIWGVVIALIMAILILPRYLNKMLNIGPVLGVLAFIAMALALPYAIKVTLSPTNTPSRASSDIQPSNINVELTGPEEVVITWQTNVPVLGAIRYGTTADNLEMAAFALDPLEKKINHETPIANLQPNTTYYYHIISGDQKFGDNGQPLQFTTPAQ